MATCAAPGLDLVKGAVECLVAELRARPADQHHVHGPEVLATDQGDALQIFIDLAAVEQEAPGARVVVVQVGGCESGGGENVRGGDREAGPARAAAIDARGREVALVTSASGSPAERSRSAATAPGSGRHDTVSTPSMSISTAPTCMPRP
ncbi:MAG TPA: hypothetical protein VFJ07_20565 [Streptosporangiaceae bacterium]|nr:hypothetical protein [Streptosporangiaceae bacterium]